MQLMPREMVVVRRVLKYMYENKRVNPDTGLIKGLQIGTICAGSGVSLQSTRSSLFTLIPVAISITTKQYVNGPLCKYYHITKNGEEIHERTLKMEYLKRQADEENARSEQEPEPEPEPGQEPEPEPVAEPPEPDPDPDQDTNDTKEDEMYNVRSDKYMD